MRVHRMSDSHKENNKRDGDHREIYISSIQLEITLLHENSGVNSARVRLVLMNRIENLIIPYRNSYMCMVSWLHCDKSQLKHFHNGD